MYMNYTTNITLTHHSAWLLNRTESIQSGEQLRSSWSLCCPLEDLVGLTPGHPEDNGSKKKDYSD